MTSLGAMRTEGCACFNCRHWQRNIKAELDDHHPCARDGSDGEPSAEVRMASPSQYVCELWETDKIQIEVRDYKPEDPMPT